MEWSRAKNIIIVTLIVLNTALAALNFVSDFGSSISGRQKNEILKILEQNNIKYSFANEKEYKELEKISTSKFEYDYNKINEIFFEHPENLKPKIEADNYVYSDNTGTLIGEDYKNGFTYRSQVEPTGEKSDIQTAERLCDAVVRKLGPEFDGFRSESSYYDSDGVIVIYKQFFKGYKINTNEIKFLVSNGQIIQASCIYTKPVKFLKETKNSVYSSLDALFAYMSYKSATEKTAAENLETEESPEYVEIEKISLVYEKDQLNDEQSFIPCYAVYLKGKTTPILINAYKNTVIE